MTGPSLAGLLGVAALTLIATSGMLDSMAPRRRLAVVATHRRSLRDRLTDTVRTIVPASQQAELDPSQVASWLDDVAAAVRAGHSLTTAILTPGPDSAHHSIDPLQRMLAGGERLADAVDRWASTISDSSLGVVASTLLFADDIGGSPAEPIERAAAFLRRRAAEHDERRASSAQARLSAIVMAILPVGMLGFLVSTNDGVRAFVITPPGLALVALGTSLDALGFWWMRAIVRRAER